jgi:hypothetical protein
MIRTPTLDALRADTAAITFSESGPAWRLPTRESAHVFRDGQERDQLSDLIGDPHERNNLAQDLALVRPLAGMKHRLLQKMGSATFGGHPGHERSR